MRHHGRYYLVSIFYFVGRLDSINAYMLCTSATSLGEVQFRIKTSTCTAEVLTRSPSKTKSRLVSRYKSDMFPTSFHCIKHHSNTIHSIPDQETPLNTFFIFSKRRDQSTTVYRRRSSHPVCRTTSRTVITLYQNNEAYTSQSICSHNGAPQEPCGDCQRC